MVLLSVDLSNTPLSQKTGSLPGRFRGVRQGLRSVLFDLPRRPGDNLGAARGPVSVHFFNVRDNIMSLRVLWVPSHWRGCGTPFLTL